MICRMNFTLMFDRTINKETVSISPGGYEFITNDDETFRFDFFTSYGGVDGENTVHFEVNELDTDTFPESKFITVDDLNNIKKFTEFYVDIEDTESVPVLKEIKDVVIEYYDEKEDRIITVEIPDELFTKNLYEQFKAQWIEDHIDDITMTETMTAYENDEDAVDMTFDEYVESFGFRNGLIYPCFEEFAAQEMT